MKTPFRPAGALLLLLALPPGASAGIHKCTMPDGRVTFSDAGCAAASRTSSAYMPPPSAIGGSAQNRERMRSYAQFNRRERERQERAAPREAPAPEAGAPRPARGR